MFEYRATVVRWVDGDTVLLAVDLGFNITSVHTFRLNGIDTPERGHPGYLEATARARELAPVGEEVSITTYRPDKYGRWLVAIHLLSPWPTLNEVLIAEGLAVPYFGGAKPS